MSIATFKTQVSGIPCLCVVEFYQPALDAPMTGTDGMGFSEPPSDEEFEFRLEDRSGYKAAWLEDKLTPSDQERLLHEFLSL